MLILEIVIAVLLIAGGIFTLIGNYGLLKLRDTMQRLHAPTKATTLGVGAALIASVLYFAGQGAATWQELLITVFLLIGAPISANFIAKAYIHLNSARLDLPKPAGEDKNWATLTPDQE